VTWLSDDELAYAQYEPAPRTDSNLWVVDINASTGLPSGAAHRLTHWTDFQIYELSASADGSRLCFLRSSAQSDIYVGVLQARGTRLASPYRLTLEEAYNGPTAWTPDSKAILFESNRYGQLRIYKQDIDKDTAELITSGLGTQQRPRISPDGRWVLYLASDDTAGSPKTRLMRIPLAGGSAQEVLSGDVTGAMCSHTAGGACVLAEMRGNVSTFFLLDPIKGRGPKVLETTIESGKPAISPDGQHIAFVLPGLPRNRIRIVDLRGATERDITISAAEYLASLDWSADRTGFFSGDMHSDTERLLYIERNGASHVLWTQAAAGFGIWGIPSPDGRYLATFKANASANVWMVENP
jgi:Tol biopolymer transport system component